MKLSLIALLFATVVMPAQAADALPRVLRIHAYSPSLAASGQPKRSQFSDIAAAGYQVIINVASPDSNPAGLLDEKQLVELSVGGCGSISRLKVTPAHQVRPNPSLKLSPNSGPQIGRAHV